MLVWKRIWVYAAKLSQMFVACCWASLSPAVVEPPAHWSPTQSQWWAEACEERSSSWTAWRQWATRPPLGGRSVWNHTFISTLLQHEGLPLHMWLVTHSKIFPSWSTSDSPQKSGLCTQNAWISLSSRWSCCVHHQLGYIFKSRPMSGPIIHCLCVLLAGRPRHRVWARFLSNYSSSSASILL